MARNLKYSHDHNDQKKKKKTDQSRITLILKNHSLNLYINKD